MANDIYITTHSGLSNLVSPRVASRVLENALRKRKLKPESITAKEMKSLLRGPILNDLKGILPLAGLKRNLQQLSKTVAAVRSAPTLVEALNSPEPWDDTPPLSTPGSTLPETASSAAGQRIVLEESPAPAKSAQPSVSLTKSGETALPNLAFDPEPVASLGETAVAEPEAHILQAEEMVADPHTEALEVQADVNIDGEAYENVNAQETLNNSPLSETEEEADLTKTDPYATLAESALPDPVFEEAEPNVAPADTKVSEAQDTVDSARIAEAPEVEESSASLSASEEASPTSRDETTELSDEALERAVLQFAQLDHVRMVAALRASGEVANSRGSGFDLKTLSRLGTLGLKLLARSGELRSYYLAFKEGQLFFFPLQTYTLCIIGTAELNLGLVFATLQKLKEDA